MPLKAIIGESVISNGVINIAPRITNATLALTIRRWEGGRCRRPTVQTAAFHLRTATNVATVHIGWGTGGHKSDG